MDFQTAKAWAEQYHKGTVANFDQTTDVELASDRSSGDKAKEQFVVKKHTSVGLTTGRDYYSTAQEDEYWDTVYNQYAEKKFNSLKNDPDFINDIFTNYGIGPNDPDQEDKAKEAVFPKYREERDQMRKSAKTWGKEKTPVLKNILYEYNGEYYLAFPLVKGIVNEDAWNSDYHIFDKSDFDANGFSATQLNQDESFKAVEGWTTAGGRPIITDSVKKKHYNSLQSPYITVRIDHINFISQKGQTYQ